GATVTLVFALAVKAPAPVPVILGIVVGLGLLALALYYQHLRLTPVVLSSSTSPASPAVSASLDPASRAADRDAGSMP
ncbi:MAG TPA: hypothetical protein VMG13_26970, partial [Trebonia sp.]|nr:hypothetical protein [Trebonia sp.]